MFIQLFCSIFSKSFLTGFVIPLGILFSVIGLIKIIPVVLYNRTDYAKLTKNSYSKVHSDVGLQGEYQIYKRLAGFKRKMLFNIYVPKDDTTTEIDVIMIHNTGIYVIESKNYSGWIFGDERQYQWYQTLPKGRRSHKEKFNNPIMQNNTHIKYLSMFLSEFEKAKYHSIIAFSERCELKKIERITSIPVINRQLINQAVLSIAHSTGECLTDDEVNAIYEKLYPLSQVSEQQKLQHILNIKKPKATNEHAPKESPEKNIETEVQNAEEIVKCPLCGDNMVLRKVKKGENAGNEFYGCVKYPKCRGIIKLKENAEINESTEPIPTVVEQNTENIETVMQSTDEAVKCPLCGEDMVMRKAKRGENAGIEFYGCSKYPKCKGIIVIENQGERL